VFLRSRATTAEGGPCWSVECAQRSSSTTGSGILAERERDERVGEGGRGWRSGGLITWGREDLDVRESLLGGTHDNTIDLALRSEVRQT